MASDAPRSPRLEIAHVLFMDLVGYSVLPLEAQPEAQGRLQVLVRATRAFRDAEARDELIRLPVGDGMPLVFRRDPTPPRRGQFCYVLTTRQMGKSSLMVRTAARLQIKKL